MMVGGFMWVFWIAVLVGLFFLVKSLSQQGRPKGQGSELNPLEVLKKRYT